jgi:septum site-determining protein MinC
MQDELIAIKGIKDGLLINLNTTEEWLSITEELATHIDEKADFFAGANVTVDLGNRPVPKYELSSLKALLERRKLILTVVLSDSDTTNQSAIALDMRTETGNVVPGREAQETIPINSEETGTHGVLFRRTLRSGRTIHSDGHVIVYGDVNPGAKIIATGDIIVWGKLRGTVHAGAEGDENAIVCALDMSPNQLRIAGYIVTSPPGKRGDVYPEVALIRNNQIVVEARD